tara:strand:- start:380 stop:1018 length:639 start_codon:yes stop_codon:yes gene_type:complete
MLKDFEKRVLSSLIIIPVALFFIVQGSFFFMFFLSILFFLTIYEWMKLSKKNHILKLLGIIFLIFSFYAAFEIRGDDSYSDFLFILTICIFTDVGGYTFGKTFKGPKLTKISPKKTYTGAIGSFLLSILAGLIFIKYLFTEIKFFTDENSILLIILIISFISQIGDLIISYLKRKARLKDTGKILPGHGGLLDRIDGMIFVFPTIYIITHIK